LLKKFPKIPSLPPKNPKKLQKTPKKRPIVRKTWAESIEFVELELKLVLESCGILRRRIGPGFSKNWTFFGRFLQFFGFSGASKGIFENFFLPIDRAR